ncbi:MAG: UTP--glucose-1-phosphate uridylyltransferase [Candidatus Wildermuthbacteria bacterium]|nr:UTP--glucose-1-phosphate uridylyltransferase [Candidatus Wildermuthbacteria bacterium]
MGEITKAIIPLGGLGTRFLPLSRVVTKEFFPLVEKPLVHYVIEELRDSGVKEIVFVTSQSNKKALSEYFKNDLKLEKLLEEQKKEDLLKAVRNVAKLSEEISFSFVQQANPLGDGHAVLQAQKLIGNEPCFVAYPDDVMESAQPVSLQLAKVYKTSEKPVLALYRMPKEKLVSYGSPECEKIANRLYKIRKIAEKPSLESVPSEFAIVGRRIITPEVFSYLKKAKPNKKGEVVLSEVLGEMVKDGKIVYGYEIEGKWWECGDKRSWLFSNTALALKHPEFGKDLQKFIKDEKLIKP